MDDQPYQANQCLNFVHSIAAMHLNEPAPIVLAFHIGDDYYEGMSYDLRYFFFFEREKNEYFFKKLIFFLNIQNRFGISFSIKFQNNKIATEKKPFLLTVLKLNSNFVHCASLMRVLHADQLRSQHFWLCSIFSLVHHR